eukprot:6570115-Prymnesium_polylepis.2
MCQCEVWGARSGIVHGIVVRRWPRGYGVARRGPRAPKGERLKPYNETRPRAYDVARAQVSKHDSVDSSPGSSVELSVAGGSVF